MALDVIVDGFEKFHCSYSSFSIFRRQILRGWNKEFGVLYELYFKIIDHGSIEEIYKREFDILNKYTRNQLLDPFFIETKLDEILNEYDKPYNEGMKIFAHHSDYDGELTPEESVLVLKSFNRVNPDNFKKLDVYYNTWCRNSLKLWKKMLAYAIENNKIIEFA